MRLRLRFGCKNFHDADLQKMPSHLTFTTPKSYIPSETQTKPYPFSPRKRTQKREESPKIRDRRRAEEERKHKRLDARRGIIKISEPDGSKSSSFAPPRAHGVNCVEKKGERKRDSRRRERA